MAKIIGMKTPSMIIGVWPMTTIVFKNGFRLILGWMPTAGALTTQSYPLSFSHLEWGMLHIAGILGEILVVPLVLWAAYILLPTAVFLGMAAIQFYAVICWIEGCFTPMHDGWRFIAMAKGLCRFSH